MTQSATHPIHNLSPREVAQLLSERQILLIDVREPDEYANQRIAGALLFPLSTLDTSFLPRDGAQRVVFQCGSGKRSALAAKAFLATGAAVADHLAGGIGAWLAEGLPVIRLDPASGKAAGTY